jgi:hypothetical protein
VVAAGAAVGAVLGAALGGVRVVSIFLAAFLMAFGATFFAVFMAVGLGGKAVIQHYLLRLLLWRSGRFPRNITRFLDWAAQRVLVQRVGGGWQFVHRTLQERFAERHAEERPGERLESTSTQTLAPAAITDGKT